MIALMASRVEGSRCCTCVVTHLFGVRSMWPLSSSSASWFSSCWLVGGLGSTLTTVGFVIASGTGVGSSKIEVITTVGRNVGSGADVAVG